MAQAAIILPPEGEELAQGVRLVKVTVAAHGRRSDTVLPSQKLAWLTARKQNLVAQEHEQNKEQEISWRVSAHQQRKHQQQRPQQPPNARQSWLLWRAAAAEKLRSSGGCDWGSVPPFLALQKHADGGGGGSGGGDVARPSPEALLPMPVAKAEAAVEKFKDRFEDGN